MRYEVQIRMNSIQPTKWLVASEGAEDLNQAFTRANELLVENKDCFAQIREEGASGVVCTLGEKADADF